MKGLFWGALASGPLAVGLWLWASTSPGLVESWYSRGLYPLLAAPWSRLVGLVPWAVAPWVIVALVVGAIAAFVLVPPLRALGWVGAGASVLVAWFVLGWGLNYQRLSWAQNHGLTVTGGTVADLEALAHTLAQGAGNLRPRALAASPDWSGPGVRRAVTAAYERWGATEPLVAGRWGHPKAFPVPEVLSVLGIGGIYIPHTGEPLVNTGPGNWQLPFTSAHEAAHLRGWAREDEANFLAFLVLQDDPDPALGYSAWSSALLSVASALGSGPEGAAAWSRVAAATDPGVLADWRASFAYWDRFQGPVMEASHAVNDVYLKSQGQADGIKSYGRMVDLLLVWKASSGHPGGGPRGGLPPGGAPPGPEWRTPTRPGPR